MPTALLTRETIPVLLNMSQIDINKAVSQMTALMDAISGEKQNIDSMAEMLVKQQWYKNAWFAITGKNKASAADIPNYKVKLFAYIAQSLAVLYYNNTEYRKGS